MQQIPLSLDILIAQVVVQVVEVTLCIATRPTRKFFTVSASEARLAGASR